MIYLDNAATTKVYDEISAIITKYNSVYYYNPSALYKSALNVTLEMDSARSKIAAIIGCAPDEIFFTSGATEANNTVIMNAHKNKKGLIVTSQGEHPSVYNACVREAAKGSIVKYLPLNGLGEVNTDGIESLKDVSLVSLIHVSNETGAVNDIENIVKQIRKNNKNALIHSDGVQAVGKVPVNVKKLGVDLYSFSGHKLHAPKGTGILYIRKGIKIPPLLTGGGQERDMRPGTENVSGIMALSYALNRKIDENNLEYVNKLKSIFIEKLSGISGLIINSGKNSVPHILSLSIDNIRGEVLLHSLEKHGIIIGTGSACSSKHSGNRVLSSMGITEKLIQGSIRLSYNEYLREEDVMFACEKIAEEIRIIRGISG